MTERQAVPTRTEPTRRRARRGRWRRSLWILALLVSFLGGSLTPARAEGSRGAGGAGLPVQPAGLQAAAYGQSAGLVTAASGDALLVRPAQNGTVIGTSATLEVLAGEPGGGTRSVSFYGRRKYDAPVPGPDFTLVVLPDTQGYVANPSYTPIFTQQTQWIADNQAALNIAFVTHVGDIVDNGASATEYDRADASMGVLDAAGVPYSVGPGNHDMVPSSRYEEYFGVSRFQGKPWYAGHYGSNNFNNYSLFSTSGNDFILINLQFDPQPAHLDWADALLKAYPERRGIVVSHNILNVNDNWSNQGIFTALKDNPNLFLMLCGHRTSSNDGAAYRAELGDAGQTIHILLANYQSFPNGGNGWMRLLRFSPADSKIYVTTYSPYLNEYRTGHPEQMQLTYALDLPEGEPFELLGVVENVPGGGSAALTWNGLATGATYEWYAVVEGAEGDAQSDLWTFNTVANAAPELSPIGVLNVDEGSTLAFTAAASDANLPYQTLTFSLAGELPEGALFTEQGAFTWTPTEAQGPGVYTFTVRACDDGAPPLCDEEQVTIQVAEVNSAPALAAIGVRSVFAGETLAFTAPASDGDLPAQALTFSLSGAPAGAAIHPATGAFTWTPSEAQAGREYTFAVRVCDDGSPVLCDEEALTVRVDRRSQGEQPPPPPPSRSYFLPFVSVP